MVVKHNFNEYSLELNGVEVAKEKVDSISPDLTAFYGICHAIFYSLKRGLKGSIESTSEMAVKWVKEEATPIETQRTKDAIKYLKSIPTKKTLNIEKYEIN